jgi:hypothetical protein
VKHYALLCHRIGAIVARGTVFEAMENRSGGLLEDLLGDCLGKQFYRLLVAHRCKATSSSDRIPVVLNIRFNPLLQAEPKCLEPSTSTVEPNWLATAVHQVGHQDTDYQSPLFPPTQTVSLRRAAFQQECRRVPVAKPTRLRNLLLRDRLKYELPIQLNYLQSVPSSLFQDQTCIPDYCEVRTGRRIGSGQKRGILQQLLHSRLATRQRRSKRPSRNLLVQCQQVRHAMLAQKRRTRFSSAEAESAQQPRPHLLIEADAEVHGVALHIAQPLLLRQAVAKASLCSWIVLLILRVYLCRIGR